MIDILLWTFAITAAMAAVLLLLTKSVLNGAYLLVVCLLSLAALYVLLGAEFVGVTQLMIYVGGVIVLLLFGVMLTRKQQGRPMLTSHYNRFYALLAAAAIFTSLSFLVTGITLQGFSKIPGNKNLLQETGIQLMTTYLLPMELIAMLLLVVLIGASTIASENQRREVGQ
jgi:NADH:ubiquinone oxidoreductase subunit 6 (subunit J)